MSEWKTIDSAPKDGTHILLAPSMEGDRHGSREGFWTEMYGGVWYMSSVGHLNGFWRPTHWMPLPEPRAMTRRQRYFRMTRWLPYWLKVSVGLA